MWIYVIRNCINGKLYVGQTERIIAEERWKEHVCNVNSSRRQVIYDAMRKYGIESFEFVPWEQHASFEELNDAEEFWVKFFRSWEPEFGYNRTMGGKQARLTPTSRQKLSELNRGEKNPFYGKHHSELAKRAIGEAQTGNQHGKGFKFNADQLKTLSKSQLMSWQSETRRIMTSDRVKEECANGVRHSHLQSQKDTAMKLLQQGTSVKDICFQLGISRSTVYRVKNAL